MDRNSVIGLLLIGLIMVVFTFINKPDEKVLEKERQEKLKQAAAAKSPEKKKQAVKFPVDTSAAFISDSANNVILSQKFGEFANAAQGTDRVFTIENDLIKATIRSKGGFVEQVILKNYKTSESHNSRPLVLFEPDSTEFAIEIPLQNKMVSTADLYFLPAETKPVKVGGADSASFAIRAMAADGKYLEFVYGIKGGSYLMDMDIHFQGLEQAINVTASALPVHWSMTPPAQEKNLDNERQNTTIYYKNEEEVDNADAISPEKKTLESPVKWLGMKQQFFTSTIIASESFENAAEIETRSVTGTTHTKRLIANFKIPFKAASEKDVNLKFYYGPNHFPTLKEAGYDLQKQIPLGWGIFGWVNKIIVIPVFNFFGAYNLNYGLVILLLTLVIKTILFPFQFRSYLSQAKMRVLKPEIDELNKEYEKEDAMKKQQAVMALYKKAGVNPLGGCVPLLFQLPILLALFNFFPNAIELRQQSFLWAEDLSTWDSIATLPFSIPQYGDHVSLFALLMTISTIVYTRMNNQLSGANNQMPQLKWMMYLMPVIFLFVLNSYAAGLNYYYFLANVITFGQQFAFTKLVDEKKIHAKIQENKLKPATSKVSGFQQKLEEMAKKRGYQPPKK